MAGFLGADTDQLREHASACRTGADRLEDVLSRAGDLVLTATWTGPDADAFRERWSGQVVPQALSRIEEIRRRGDDLEGQAEEQDETSARGGGLGDVLGDLLDDLLPDLPFDRELLPWPWPTPGMPLTPDVLDHLGGALADWFSGGGGKGPQEFFGTEGFGPGQIAADGRPIGHSTAGGEHWQGREIDNGLGYFDGYAHTRASAGAHATTDPYGNWTGTLGARAGAEIGFQEALYGPDGTPLITADGRLGAEAYAEAGLTAGTDGLSTGARIGAGVYGDISAGVNGPLGIDTQATVEASAEVDAHANAYAHVTRNDEGQVNGVTWGSEASATAQASISAEFEQSSPGGWFSASGGVGVSAGAGAGVSTGGSFSTDEISIDLGASLGLGLGGAFDLGLAVHPNEIVNDVLPGDYDIDDAISDASGAFEGAKDVAGDALSAVNPFD